MQIIKYSNLSDIQQEVLNGSLLGDATLYYNKQKPNSNSKFVKSQSQLDNCNIDKINYMKWHFETFNCYSSSIKNGIKNGISQKKYPYYVFATHCHPIFTELEKKWYLRDVNGNHVLKDNKRIKIIPKDLTLTPLTVCVWFMDDGSLDAKRGNAVFCTQGFSIEDNKFLIERLKNDVGIKSCISFDKGNPKLYIGVEHHKKLINLIKPYVEWDCFKYKLDDSYNKLPRKEHKGEKHNLAKFTESEINKMIQLRKNGKPVMELANIYNTSHSNISLITSGKRWKHLNNHIEIKSKPRVNKDQKENIIKLYLEGYSQNKIAIIIGKNQSTISRIINRYIK